MKSKMSKWLGASVLLVLSLEVALLVAGVDDDDLRLPSDTQVAAAAPRPWKCCDTAGCTRSIPPICHCADEVEQCGPSCKRCEASTLHPSLFVCKDRYVGDPGPMCRPWKCCDGAACTKSIPPICRCGDEVDECAATCKKCVASPTNPSRYVCKDTFRGFPGPICRPWDCCDAAFCTKSIPPICHCQDEVEQCAATCGDCTASTSDPSRNVCNDQYRGDPGPRCTDALVGTAGGN